jgi:hypothetical protein
MDIPTEILVEPATKAVSMFDNVRLQMTALSNQAMSFLPSNFNVWLIAITCLVVLVAISRIITLQKSVTELQSRPIFDENTVRISVRQHLEETVKAMEQHNKAQHMARQAEAQARDEQMRQMVIKQAQEQQAAKEQQAKEQQAREQAAKAEAEAAQEASKTKVTAEPPVLPTVVTATVLRDAEDEQSVADDEEKVVQTPPRKKSSKKSSSSSTITA